MAGVRLIKAYRPQRGAVKILARHAFDKEKSYGDAWEKYKQQNPLARLCSNCRQRPARARHHHLPISKGGKHLKSNIDDLCEICHEKLHPHLQRRRRKILHAK